MNSSEIEPGKVKRVRRRKRRRHRSFSRRLARLTVTMKPYLLWIFYISIIIFGLIFGYRFLGPKLSGM